MLNGRNSRCLPKALRITRYENQMIRRTRFDVRYANPEHSVYQRLREKYDLEKIVRSASCPLDQIITVRDWLRGRWAHGWDGTYLTANALDIMEEAEQGKEFHCWYFTMAFCACVTALGFHARPVAIGKTNTDFVSPEEINISHVVAEVWLDDFGKWAVMDEDTNSHYVRDSVPLNAYELRMAWLRGEKEDVKRLAGDTPATITSKTNTKTEAEKRAIFADLFRNDLLDYYHYLRYLLRTDLSEAHDTDLSHLEWRATSLAFGSDNMPAVQWIDSYSLPQIYMESWPIPMGLKFTDSLDDVYWTLNQAEVDLRLIEEPTPQKPPVISVSIDTVTPHFSHFEVRLNRNTWTREQSEFRWPLREGENTIEARAVNSRGIQGIVSLIEVEYRP